MNIIEAAKKAGCNDEFIKMAPDWLERFAAYIREALAEQRTYPNLEPVINWLEKGCDPKEAAKELRIYAESMKDHFAASGKPMDHIANAGKMIAEPEYYDCGGTIGVVHKSQCSAAMKRNGKPWKCACGANLYIDSNGAPASKAEHKCSDHPDAPHGFERNGKTCEAWSPEDMAYRPNGLSMDTQDQYEVGTLEDADILKQRIQELEQQNAALKAVVDAWNNVEPVKQEPVAWMNTNGAVNKLRKAGWAMNAAPVDAKAIRAEALEEAANWCDDYAAECAANENWEAEDVSLINAAAIRGLK